MIHINRNLRIVNQPRAGNTILAVPRRAHMIAQNHPLRKMTEAFIRNRFLEVHGASITHFMPLLFAVFNARGEVLATLGIRTGSEALFLEFYLDKPIDQVISRHAIAGQQTVYRDRLVEIGNLASVDRRASMLLFRFMADYLMQQKFDWATFTGGAALRGIFTQLGIETISLGSASQDRLPVAQQHWGSYYYDNPCILAGRVANGQALIQPAQANREVAA